MHVVPLYCETPSNFDPCRSILKQTHVSARDATMTEKFTLIYIHIYIYIYRERERERERERKREKDNKNANFSIVAESK